MRGTIAVCALLLCGCASAPVDRVVTVSPDRYARAFEAAVAAGRDAGLDPVVRDMRRGVIETRPAFVPSWLEPWSGIADAENTVAFQRRWARFQFVPAGGGAPEEAAGPADRPDLLATGEPPVDLRGFQGPLELRVRVILERAFAPGIRRDTWSRRMSSQATVTRGAAETPPASFWAPIGRDPDLEAKLREAIAVALAD